jgi:hypothetical protein
LANLDVTNADFSGADLTGAHAYNVDWEQAKVPPSPLPEPFVKLPTWVWSVLLGGLLGAVTLLIYALIRKRKKQ